MGKYVAKRHLTIGDGKGHRTVKAGETFECSDDYAKAHLIPHKHCEPHASKVEAAAEEPKGKGKKE